MSDHECVTEQDVARAAEQLRDTIMFTTWELSDELTGRPELGTPEWMNEYRDRHTPTGRRRRVESLLVNLRIMRQAGLTDVDGIVTNIISLGGTWNQIAHAVSTDAETAQNRWPITDHTIERLSRLDSGTTTVGGE